jgi:hypothetical protein
LKGTEEKSIGDKDISNNRNVEVVNMESRSTGNGRIGLHKEPIFHKKM